MSVGVTAAVADDDTSSSSSDEGRDFIYIFFFLLGDCELLQQGQVIKVTEYNNASLHFFFLPSSLARILKNATPPASESR